MGNRRSGSHHGHFVADPVVIGRPGGQNCCGTTLLATKSPFRPQNAAWTGRPETRGRSQKTPADCLPHEAAHRQSLTTIAVG